MQEKAKFFDVRTTDPRVVARVFQEEREIGDLRARVVHADVYRRCRIEEDRWDFNIHSDAEREATVHAFELLDDGFDFVVWISPRSQIYKEGRLNLMIKSGNDCFEPWGVPLLLNNKESLELANKLIAEGGISMDPIYDDESLRKQPIGFKLGDKKWIDMIRKLMPEFGEIWRFIESGGVEVNEQEIMVRVEAAMRAAKGDNYVFESEMLRFGYKLYADGPHGGSYLGDYANGIYKFDIQRVDGQYYVDRVKVNGRYVCPLCGVEIDEGEDVCPKCGINLKE